MTQLLLDPEYTRVLANELQRNAQSQPQPFVTLPDAPGVTSFSHVLETALNNVYARAEALRADVGHLSRAGTALVDAATATDDSHARQLGATEV